MRPPKPPPPRKRRSTKPPHKGTRQAKPPNKPKPSRRKKPAPPAAIKGLDPSTTVRRRGNVYYLFHKTNRRIPWRIVIAFLVVFLGAMGSAYSRAQIHYITVQMEQTRQQLASQQVRNHNLESQLTRNYSRDEIERIASERLGMAPPDPSQIIYFYVPHVSGVMMPTYTPEETVATENYFWQEIVGFFRGISDRLFGG